MKRRAEGRIHIVIPDTQCKPGVDLSYLKWINAFIVAKYKGRDVSFIHLGDHWDMPSLSSYDEGKKAMEGRRVLEDIKVGNRAFATLAAGTDGFDCHFLEGNHEQRLQRVGEFNPQLDGVLPAVDVKHWKWRKFLLPLVLDGVSYAHYFYNPMTGKPYGGMIENRLKHLGRTFTMGHQQTLMYGVRFVGDRSQHGLVAGSCYTHDEEYKGPQGNAHWRGIIVKHDVNQGSYDPMFVSLKYLEKRYG